MKMVKDVVKGKIDAEKVKEFMSLDAPVTSTEKYNVFRVANSPISIEIEYPPYCPAGPDRYDDPPTPIVHVKDGYFKTFVFGKKTEALCGLYGLTKKIVKTLWSDERLCYGFFNMIYAHATETKTEMNSFYRFDPQDAERDELVKNLITLYTKVNPYDVKLHKVIKFATTEKIRYIYRFMNDMM